MSLGEESRRTLDRCLALDEPAAERFQDVSVVAEAGLRYDARKIFVGVPEQKSFELENAKNTKLLEQVGVLIYGGSATRHEELCKCHCVLLYIGIQTRCMLILDDSGFRYVQRSEDKVTSKNRENRVCGVVGCVCFAGEERLRKDETALE